MTIDLLVLLAPVVALAIVACFAYAGCTIDRAGLGPPPGLLHVTLRFVDAGVADPTDLRPVLVTASGIAMGTASRPVIREAFFVAEWTESFFEGRYEVGVELRDAAGTPVLATPGPCVVTIASGETTSLSVSQTGPTELRCDVPATAMRTLRIALHSFHPGAAGVVPACRYAVLRADLSTLMPGAALAPVPLTAPTYPDTRFEWRAPDLPVPDGRYVVRLELVREGSETWEVAECPVAVLGAPRTLHYLQTGPTGPLRCGPLA